MVMINYKRKLVAYLFWNATTDSTLATLFLHHNLVVFTFKTISASEIVPTHVLFAIWVVLVAFCHIGFMAFLAPRFRLSVAPTIKLRQELLFTTLRTVLLAKILEMHHHPRIAESPRRSRGQLQSLVLNYQVRLPS
jgi:hypothetical protein